MKYDQPEGQGISLVTPFTDRDAIDFPALERIVHHVATQNVDFLVVRGTSSEIRVLDANEKGRVLAFIQEINDNRLPLIVGVGGADTRSVAAEVEALSEFNVQGILAASPVGGATSQSGYAAHFLAVVEACKVPVIIHNRASERRGGMQAETMLKLARHERIVGVKESSGDINVVSELLRNRPAGFRVLSGADDFALPMMALGADGVISTIGNAFPETFGFMVQQALFGQFTEARKIHHDLSPVMRLLREAGDPTGIKTVLSHLGLCSAQVRLPNTQVDAALSQKFYRAVAALEPEVALA
jgi:4-hydroxy-tetrahydrodipicolinate synthase